MKSTIFLKPLEYNIIAEGQKWRQGDKLHGSFKIKNHGEQKIELSGLDLSLAVGNFKKIKSKDQKAWAGLEKKDIGKNISLHPAEEKEFAWDFLLPEDCAVTDNNGSLFLTFVTPDEAWPLGQLELVIEPKLVMFQFLEIMENFFRFKVGAKKFSKNMVEIKLTPPKSRELGHIEGLVLRMKEKDGVLDLEYIFTMHVLETVGTNVSTQKKVKQIDQQLKAKSYSLSKEYLDQDFVMKSINDVLKEVMPKLLL